MRDSLNNFKEFKPKKNQNSKIENFDFFDKISLTENNRETSRFQSSSKKVYFKLLLPSLLIDFQKLKILIFEEKDSN